MSFVLLMTFPSEHITYLGPLLQILTLTDQARNFESPQVEKLKLQNFRGSLWKLKEGKKKIKI